MSWKTKAHKIYEARVVNDALARLAVKLDLNAVQLSAEELQIFAERSRESFRGRQRAKERLLNFRAQLSAKYGAECVETIATALETINNAIGYEEK